MLIYFYNNTWFIPSQLVRPQNIDYPFYKAQVFWLLQSTNAAIVPNWAIRFNYFSATCRPFDRFLFQIGVNVKFSSSTFTFFSSFAILLSLNSLVCTPMLRMYFDYLFIDTYIMSRVRIFNSPTHFLLGTCTRKYALLALIQETNAQTIVAKKNFTLNVNLCIISM